MHTTDSSRRRPSTALRVLLPMAAVVFVALPVFIYFSVRGTVMMQGPTPRDVAVLAFPLFGLVAFSLLWVQLLLGSNMPMLRAVYPRITTFHRIEGVFVLLFALLHPALLLLGVGWTAYWAKTYVPPNLVPYVWIGYLQLIILVVTAGTALLARIPFVRRYWRSVHVLNYALFGLVWVHSWFLGSDVRTTGLRWVWIGMAATAAVSVAGRLWRLRQRTPPRVDATVSATEEGFVAVAAEADLADGKPHCAMFNGRRLVLADVGGTIYCLDNVCTHTGGSLCEGTLRDGIIECPLHASRFRMRDGSVVQGPARRPQAVYAVRRADGRVWVKLTAQ